MYARFSDIVGDITIDDTHLKRFLSAWFYPEDSVAIVGIPKNRKSGGVLSYVLPAKDIYDSTNTDIYKASTSDDGREFNIYFSVFPLKADHNVSLYHRGTKKDVKHITGVFVDLDVKPGAFESKDQIRSFLASLDLQPTIVVDNGQSGGIHAYWRFRWGESTESEEILHRWWAYVQSKTPEGVVVDRLVDSSRIARLASFINWSRDETEKDDTVKVITAEGPTHSIEEMVIVSSEAYEARKRKISETHEAQNRARFQARSVAAETYTALTGDAYTGWDKMFMISRIEDHVNNNTDWDDLLPKHGWVCKRELYDNQGREWARPGQTARSATTDFVHETGEISPVMSLFSMSEDTGLADLKEAEIPLTKYRVKLRLDYADDEKAMIADLVNEIGQKAT